VRQHERRPVRAALLGQCGDLGRHALDRLAVPGHQLAERLAVRPQVGAGVCGRSHAALQFVGERQLEPLGR
jgi:hypothetical protein